MPAWTICPTHERLSARSSANHGMSVSIRDIAAELSAPVERRSAAAARPRDRALGVAGDAGTARTLTGDPVRGALDRPDRPPIPGHRVSGSTGTLLNLAGPARFLTPCLDDRVSTEEADPPTGPHAVHYVTIHGHRRAYVKAGQGPALLLLHGLGCTHRTWLPVLDALARRYTVIAPDLLGHGESDKPRADYSVGGYANGMRDLLTVLDIDKVTVVGHSFGGGVAMQFAYQFPERTERMVLVASGGLGPEVPP